MDHLCTSQVQRMAPKNVFELYSYLSVEFEDGPSSAVRREKRFCPQITILIHGSRLFFQIHRMAPHPPLDERGANGGVIGVGGNGAGFNVDGASPPVFEQVRRQWSLMGL